jgi:hypothetical protein
MVLIWSVTFDNGLYHDKILKNIFTEDYELYLSGQNHGKYDYLITAAVENKETIKIYYRFSKTEDFIYLGQTNNTAIIKPREKEIGEKSLPEERLYINLVIDKKDIVQKKLNSSYTGVYKFKKEILKDNDLIMDCNLASALIKI